jgi:excisionase family DNA binding protein
MSAWRRRPDDRRIKSLRTYTIHEAAEALGVHRNTVRNYLRQGLVSLREKRPTLIRGSDLKAFLASRRKARRQPCKLGQIFCIKCRSPKVPALGMVDYVPISQQLGSLTGFCPDCGTLINRWTSFKRLPEIQGQLEVQVTPPQQRLSVTDHPPSDCHFKLGA